MRRSLVETVAPARLGGSFRWLLGSSWVTNIGDGIIVAAGPLLVASETRDAVPGGPGLGCCSGCRTCCFGLFAGVVADRVDRRRLVAVANACRVVVLVVLVLTIVTGEVNIALVLGAMFLLGTGGDVRGHHHPDADADDRAPSPTSASATPGSWPASSPSTSSPARRSGRCSSGWAGRSRSSPRAVCVAVSILLVLRDPAARARARPQPRSELDPPGHRRGTALGVAPRRRTHPGAHHRHLQRHLRRRLVGARPLLDSNGWTWARSASACSPRRWPAAASLGTVSYGWLERHVSLGNIMRGGLVIETFTHLALALTTTPWVAMAVFFVFGAHAFIWGTTSTSVRQRAVPTELQGRVGSVYMIGVTGGIVVGSVLGGLIAEQLGRDRAVLVRLRRLGHLPGADLAPARRTSPTPTRRSSPRTRRRRRPAPTGRSANVRRTRHAYPDRTTPTGRVEALSFPRSVLALLCSTRV